MIVYLQNINKFETKSKRHYPQVYLEEYKYRAKNKMMPEFRDVELELDSDSE